FPLPDLGILVLTDRVLKGGLAGAHVPGTQVTVVAVGQEPLAVFREADGPAAAPVAVTGQSVDLSTAPDVPEPHRVVEAGGDQLVAVGGEGDGPHPVVVDELVPLPAGRRVPDADRVVVTGRRYQARGGEGDAVQLSLVGLLVTGQLFAGGQLP